MHSASISIQSLWLGFSRQAISRRRLLIDQSKLLARIVDFFRNVTIERFNLSCINACMEVAIGTRTVP